MVLETGIKTVKEFLIQKFEKIATLQENATESNQRDELYGTAKTHKFTNIDEITINNLKFRPIFAQTETYT